MSSILAPVVGMQLLSDEVGDRMTVARQRFTELHRVWQIVLIVAIAVVLVAGIVSYAIIAGLCISKGYDRVAWSGPNGWRVWQYKIVCEKY